MTKFKFNKVERAAGLFVLAAILGVTGTMISAAIQQGWLQSKVYYHTSFETGEGIFEGTPVQISGLRAGAITKVDLNESNKIIVEFFVLNKYQDRVRADSRVQLIRPFVIGDKALDLTPGKPEFPPLGLNNYIHSVESIDLMSLASGKNMNEYMGNLRGVFESMKILAEAFTDKKRVDGLVSVIDKLEPLVVNLNTMSTEFVKISKQASKNDGVGILVQNMAAASVEINKLLPKLSEANPEMAQDIAMIAQNLAIMTKVITPALTGIEGDLPAASARLLQVLDETVVTLKAMQKSLFLRSNVQEVRDSERLPANEK